MAVRNYQARRGAGTALAGRGSAGRGPVGHGSVGRGSAAVASIVAGLATVGAGLVMPAHAAGRGAYPVRGSGSCPGGHGVRFRASSEADLLKVALLAPGAGLPALADVRLAAARGDVDSAGRPYRATASGTYADAKLLGMQVPGVPLNAGTAVQHAPRPGQSDDEEATSTLALSEKAGHPTERADVADSGGGRGQGSGGSQGGGVAGGGEGQKAYGQGGSQGGQGREAYGQGIGGSQRGGVAGGGDGQKAYGQGGSQGGQGQKAYGQEGLRGGQGQKAYGQGNGGSRGGGSGGGNGRKAYGQEGGGTQKQGDGVAGGKEGGAVKGQAPGGGVTGPAGGLPGVVAGLPGTVGGLPGTLDGIAGGLRNLTGGDHHSDGSGGSLARLDAGGIATVQAGRATAEAHWSEGYRCGTAVGPVTRSGTMLTGVELFGGPLGLPGVPPGGRTSLLRVGPTGSTQSAVDVVPLGDGRVGVAAGAGVALSDLTLFAGTSQEISIKVLTQPTLTAVAGGDRRLSRVDYRPATLRVTLAGKPVTRLDAGNDSVGVNVFGQLATVRLALGDPSRTVTDRGVLACASALRVQVILAGVRVLDVSLGYMNASAEAPPMTIPVVVSKPAHSKSAQTSGDVEEPTPVATTEQPGPTATVIADGGGGGETPTGPLALTGDNVAGVAVVAMVLIGGGVAAVFLTRRKKGTGV